MKIDTTRRGPLNTLFLAINQYISTGDHIGEGIALPSGKNLDVVIAVNKTDPTDQEDFKKFRARIAEIIEPLVTLNKDSRSDARFDYWILQLKERDLPKLTQALIDQEGPLGWGSPKPLADLALSRERRLS